VTNDRLEFVVNQVDEATKVYQTNMSSPKNTNTLVVAGIAAAASAGLTALWIKCRHEQKKNSPFVIPFSLLESPYASELKLAVKLALQAGSNMVSHCEERGTIHAQDLDALGMEFKTSPEDFCTAIDLQNEEFITQELLQEFPTYSIIGEESTGTGQLPPLSSNKTFILDPIDGTTNFASGLPLTCVSIGLCVDKIPVMGVVYSPMTNELYLGVRGHGAYRNGVRLCDKPTTTNLRHSIINFEFGYGRSKEAIARMVGAVERLLQHECRATRCLGSGVLDICYVATGRLDVVYAGVANEGWKPWDYCAALVIAVEAGCSIESLFGNDGEELDIYAKSVICAGNADLLQECRRVVLEGLQ